MEEKHPENIMPLLLRQGFIKEYSISVEELFIRVTRSAPEEYGRKIQEFVSPGLGQDSYPHATM